jgi:hypothetical protein
LCNDAGGRQTGGLWRPVARCARLPCPGRAGRGLARQETSLQVTMPTSPRRRPCVAAVAASLAIAASLVACAAEPISTPAASPSASEQSNAFVRSLSSRQLETILQREGALSVSLDEFVTAWNAQAAANPELELVITAFRDDGEGRATYEFFEFLRLEGVVNGDGTLRSIALIDETTFIDPVEIFGTNRSDRQAFMPLRAAFARYFFGRAVDPQLTTEAQGRLVEDIIGTDDPEVLRTFGKEPVEASRVVNGILYQFASDRSGNVWFIARGDDGATPSTGG